MNVEDLIATYGNAVSGFNCTQINGSMKQDNIVPEVSVFPLLVLSLTIIIIVFARVFLRTFRYVIKPS